MRTHRFELVHRIERRLRSVRSSVGASTVRARGRAAVRRRARASEEFTEHIGDVTARRGVRFRRFKVPPGHLFEGSKGRVMTSHDSSESKGVSRCGPLERRCVRVVSSRE
jgi:hypothetical protein